MTRLTDGWLDEYGFRPVPNPRSIGIEIDERYYEIATKRLGQEVLPFEGVA